MKLENPVSDRGFVLAKDEVKDFKCDKNLDFSIKPQAQNPDFEVI